MQITVPSVLSIDDSTKAHDPIRQIGQPTSRHQGTLVSFARGPLQGFVFQPTDGSEEILIIPRKTKQLPGGHLRILQGAVTTTAELADLSEGTWLNHPLRKVRVEDIDYPREVQRVLESWAEAFAYVQEDTTRKLTGLRPPQIGAVHAIHAHWAASNSVATIVMPTGTGKTEVMLAVLVSTPCPKLLVIVPTDALRTQLARKFLTLGILKEPSCAVLRPEAKHPIVCTLQHVPRTPQEVDDIFRRANVIVTTSSIVGLCQPPVQERMAHHCPYLFIDEAHHAEAPTWSAFKEKFQNRRVVQFTATPFREDGRRLDGDIIFKYPLKKAQEEGYFKPIRFVPIIAFNRKKSDEEIAKKAIEQLRVDMAKGHILMARVESVARAKEVFNLYKLYPEFNPVELHTGVKSSRQRENHRHQLISGGSRIVVCVDMLGEGFDLPELKIAAFHDIRKTLSVTLQLAGRFTRSRPDLGDATFIANTGDVNVQDELRKLYSRDPDWNVLLPQLSDSMIGEQLSLQEFLRGFTKFTKEIPLKTVRPASSAVVYRTTCEDWTPENFRTGLPALNNYQQVYEMLNSEEHTLVLVTARHVKLAWCDVEDLFGLEWELYVLIWSHEQKLLFINSSSNAGEYRALAQAVAGESAALIKGNEVFRSFAGVHRLRLQNVGLSEQLGRNVRYTGRMGADVGSELSDLQRRHARKSVLSGTGFEHGEKTSVGASRKGRIWSHRRDRIDQLIAWCKMIGRKLLDATIDPDEVLRGTLEAKTVLDRPQRMPISIDWPEEILQLPRGCLVDFDQPIPVFSK